MRDQNYIEKNVKYGERKIGGPKVKLVLVIFLPKQIS